MRNTTSRHGTPLYFDSNSPPAIAESHVAAMAEQFFCRQSICARVAPVASSCKMAIPQQVIVAAAAVAGAVLASQTACVAELADKLVSVVASLWARDETSAVLGAVFFFGLMFFVGGNPFAVSARCGFTKRIACLQV